MILATSLLACGRAGFETASELPSTPRRPDGVSLESPAARPAVKERAPAEGVVALRAPLADKDVEDVVVAYTSAFQREDIDALTRLVSEGASPIGRGGSKAQLVDMWRTRIRNLDYLSLQGSEVVRLAEIDCLSYDAFDARPELSRPAEMLPSDLYVRVPIATPRVGTEQLFGDVVVLILRREDGRLKIVGQTDEVNP